MFQGIWNRFRLSSSESTNTSVNGYISQLVLDTITILL
jgi:hypothetical protein